MINRLKVHYFNNLAKLIFHVLETGIYLAIYLFN